MPRRQYLTSFLRENMNEQPPLDLKQEHQKQQALLAKKLKLSQSREKGKLLTWKGLTSHCAGLSYERQQALRKRFNEFMELVKHVVGDSLAAGINETAFRIFHAIVKKNQKPSLVKQELEKLFGAISKGSFDELTGHAQTLYDWHTETGGQLFTKKKKMTEFGSDLEFTDPLESKSSLFSIDRDRFYFSEDEEEKDDLDIPMEPIIEVEQFSPDWLIEQCNIYAPRLPSGAYLMEPQQIFIDTLEVLHSREREIGDQLINILDPSNFDFVSYLIQNRKIICRKTRGFLDGETGIPKPGRSGPSVSGQVTVMSDKEKKYQRELRKENKKRIKEENKFKTKAQHAAEHAAIQEKKREEFDLEYNLGPTREGGFVGYQGMRLPKGTTRKKIVVPGQEGKKGKKEEYEAVHVPAPPKNELAEGDRLKIDEVFEEWARPAFAGIKSLNTIQSKSYQAAYHTTENVLVCAPTGAGKTNVALMTILQVIKRNREHGALKSASKFKIVYVAPMKALAAEITAKFSKKLKYMRLVCKELTGDMQLTKKEIQETHIIVTTPEKWDVVTRKSEEFINTVELLIIDEVHLLHEDRGPVLEVLVARTLRLIETSQRVIRIVGLSATLPNYKDVATFLKVQAGGLLFFDHRYRPVPLAQNYLAVKDTNFIRTKQMMDEVCYDRMMRSLQDGHQVMIFVHSRKETAKCSTKMLEKIQADGRYGLVDPSELSASIQYRKLMSRADKSRNREMKHLVKSGFGIHNAGMLRQDRLLVEQCFAEGIIKVLCCTATLAWGINLPAHTVIIKGTSLYNAQKGGFTDLGILDVMQIFGRAGRPQFDSSGEGIIITTSDKLNKYLALMTDQLPIESQFVGSLANHLNAEITLGTVTNMKEAMDWICYTYLYVRMLRNPMHYGVDYEQRQRDPQLRERCRELLLEAVKTLNHCKMMRYHTDSGNFFGTSRGRISSHYYIHHESVDSYNETLHGRSEISDEEALKILSESKEFQQVKVRDEELNELDRLKQQCPLVPYGGVEMSYGKVNVLIQMYISNQHIDSFTLISDMMHVSQSVGRLCRALFEFSMSQSLPWIAETFLKFAKMIDHRLWHWPIQHPLRQFKNFNREIAYKLEDRRISLDRLLDDEEERDIGHLAGHIRMGREILRQARQIPRVTIKPSVKPITRQVLQITLEIIPEFNWNTRVHGNVQQFQIWLEDETMHIYHREYFILHQKRYKSEEDIKMTFAIPISEQKPAQFVVKCISDRWLGSYTQEAISFQHMILPQDYPPDTELLKLELLPIKALKNKAFESLYKFPVFNPIQTQVFHVAYHSDTNILLGAPTGSGKTICSEFAMMRCFQKKEKLKVVYIAPLKALARERHREWTESFGSLGYKVVMLTGDHSPEPQELMKAHILITTPEKWDGISRNWKNRSYVTKIGLVVLDEIHLLGQDRGPVLEVIISRMRYITTHTNLPTRIVGLSTALANAQDLADWLGITGVGMYNFKPALRPVQLEIHVSGFPGKHYCPRMNSMNKPTYAAITSYSPDQPVIVFVSSRRQTRLTAIDLIAYAVRDNQPKRFVRMNEVELDYALKDVRDPNVKHALAFGIGLHHAGLMSSDRKVVERLFVQNCIQVVVATSTLAWGVNFPAHLVVVKGTEFYDPKLGRYVDMPLTDVLQMIGRAGRPQFDTSGVACILVHEPKKNFYKKFLNSPFPVESSLQDTLHDHINAEVVSGTIKSLTDGVLYLTWTFFYRRLLNNPSFYGLEDNSPAAVTKFLTELIEDTVCDLETSSCLEYDEETQEVRPTTLGRIASYYYMSHETLDMFSQRLKAGLEIADLLIILCNSTEYEELPVRHNEDKLNETLSKRVKVECSGMSMESPATKAFLLYQAHFSRLPLPISDYDTDLRSVLDQSIRICQAMIDVCADRGWLTTTQNVVILLQMILQARWIDDNTMLNLPHLTQSRCDELDEMGIECLPELIGLEFDQFQQVYDQLKLQKRQIQDLERTLRKYPILTVDWSVTKSLVGPGEEVFVNVKIEHQKSHDRKAHVPKWPKPREAGWFLMTGFEDDDELLSLKRINTKRKVSRQKLSFKAPAAPGEYEVSLLLFSDTYIGIDQQYEFNIQVE